MPGSLQQCLSCSNSSSSDISPPSGVAGRAAPEGSSFFRTPQRVVFFAISGLKWAMSWASLTGFSSMIAPSIDGSEASSNDPESMIMGTPCSRRRLIKLSDRSPPRRWRSTIATSGRWQACKTSASAMVAAGPATVAPQSSSNAFTACPTSHESSTKRTSRPVRSSGDLPVVGRCL